jgi:hypothetical protein
MPTAIKTRPYYLAIIGLLLGMGLCLLAIAAFIGRTSTAGAFIITFAGALTGTGIAGLITELFYPDAFRRLSHAVHLSLGTGMMSSEESIVGLRKRYHHYYVTKSHGKPVWQHGIIDFTQSYSPGRLTADTTYIDKNNSKCNYMIQAGVYRSRLVVTISLIGASEEPDICIFPFMKKLAPSYRCGIGIRECWDNTHVVAPDILIESPINNWRKIGNVDKATSEELSKFWKESIEDSHEILLCGSHSLLGEVIIPDGDEVTDAEQ